jgi:hypothetical protein
MFDACWVLTDQELGDIFYRGDDTASMPFQSRFAPAEQTVLVRHDFDKDPVSHASVAHERFDPSNLHGMNKLPDRE